MNQCRGQLDYLWQSYEKDESVKSQAKGKHSLYIGMKSKIHRHSKTGLSALEQSVSDQSNDI